MTQSLANDIGAMGRNVALLTVVCLMLCLSFNHTFPVYDTTSTTFLDSHSQPQHIKQEHTDGAGGIVDRTKKMAANFEIALRKFIDSTPNKAKAKCSHARQGVIDSDLSHYEQLVIMKKYPFLDLQELDFNLRPLSKNIGQNLNSAQDLSQDPSFCESVEEGPTVEITNRGLSGFALPTKITIDKNVNGSLFNETELSVTSTTKEPPDELRLIESLEEDIKLFEQNMG